MKTIIAIAQNLELCPIEKCSPDIQAGIREIRNESSIRKNMYQEKEIRSDEHEAWIAHVKSSKSIQFFAVLDINQKLIGGLSFSNIDMNNRRADWAFYLTSHVQGRGYGKALEFLALEYAFITLELNKLNCEVIGWNKAVQKLHETFGFQLEGIRRQHVYRNEKYHDTTLLGITANEWEKQKVKWEIS